MAPTSTQAPVLIPWLYRLFFLYIEPVATAVGAYYAHFQQHEYMHMTFPTAASAIAGSVSTRESIVLTQLANLYFVFVSHANSPLHLW